MVKRKSFLFAICLHLNLINAQFEDIQVTLDDRLLRSEEKQDILNITNDIKRFFLSTALWNFKEIYLK